MRFSNCNQDGFNPGYGPKLCWFLVHALSVALLIFLDKGLQQEIASYTWYGLLYLFLLFITIVQYYWTAGSSPGYVADLEGDSDFEAAIKAVAPSIACSRCTFCNAFQPLRTKHCHDCDKCVLRFDHHCVWLGTCIGQRNHRRFWWYVSLETLLCIWTTAIYFEAFHSKRHGKIWLQNVFLLVVFVGLICCSLFLATLLIFHSYLIITNQTTYEKTRRKRISYLRDLPPELHPFSRGACSNAYEFCCDTGYRAYDVPVAEGRDAHKTGRTWCC